MGEVLTEADPLRRAREALSRHAWREAFDLFAEADAAGGLGPEDLQRLGEAGWWVGQADRSVDARERAYAAYLAAGDPIGAARVATDLAIDYFRRLEFSVSAGWFTRARRLLENEPESEAHGYVARMEAVRALETEQNAEAALAHSRRVLDIGTRFGNRDLQALGLMDQGRALVAMGRVDEGQGLMDEAMVAAVGDELGPWVTGVVYCNMIHQCERLADYARAGEWTDAARRWCERQSITGFPGICRVHRAEIMRLRGAWAEAEDEARRACSELAEFKLLTIAGEGFNEVGEIRLRMGDLAGAEDAFAQAHELGRVPQPGLARLRLAQDRIDDARMGLQRALSDTQDRLDRARLLDAMTEVALAAKDGHRVNEAAGELEAIAGDFGTPALRAVASHARGLALLAGGDADGATRSLRQAHQRWQEVDAPYEAARTRVFLAQAYRGAGDEDAARLELNAARSAFERLGAELDIVRTAALVEGAPPARRVTRTFMFTDIVRSTNLVEAMGDEAWADLIRWHDRTLREAFPSHGGREVDHTGDGFFVSFPDADAAISCAVEIQRALAEHRRTHGFAPQIRIGVHAAEATEAGDNFRGAGVHAAARIGALAGAGEILASEHTAAAASRPTAGAREVSLKGIAEPVRVVGIDWK